MQPIKKIASLFALLSISGLSCQQHPNPTVLVCYAKLNPDSIRGYKYVILESEHYKRFDIQLIQEQNDLVLGYISLGEVSENRFYFDQISERTLGKNPVWESHFIDLNDSTTKKVVFALVDRIVEKGFNGLFLDTVDTYGPWGAHPENSGAYISFIKQIKEKYPDLHLMQNSGIALLPKSNLFINSVAIESIVTDYSFENLEYKLRKSNDFQERVSELNAVKTNYDLPIVLIEYADSKNLVKKVKDQLAHLPWDYFIGTIGLDQLPKYK